jgi:DNA polymerase/3'-5' exonuclease PolX
MVHGGYSNIDEVRKAITAGALELERNQLVGVECYEDIMEDMERSEVEAIGELIANTFREDYPNAEVQIMGSYRRGANTCGDVDVHITDKSHANRVPPESLGIVIDELWRKGHLAYHLTFLPGMETGSKPVDFSNSSRIVPTEAWEPGGRVSYPNLPKTRTQDSSSLSYMGVFNSPTISGKRRRVDIKFYPWRERAFASLYFTGNGHFNRSMRLWATRYHNYQLSDHGLYQIGSQKRVMEASSEKEVFDKLNLVFKEPTDRDGFDAVISKTGDEDIASTWLEMDQSGFREDHQNHVWIQ